MRVTFFLRQLLFVTAVWAGGYQYFVELLVNALTYEIDGLGDEADRTMGFYCEKSDWDNTAKKCRVAWRKWPSSDINKILIRLIDLPATSTNLVRDSSNNPVAASEWVEKMDLEKTATNLFNQASNHHNGPPDPRSDYELSKSGTNDWAKHAEYLGKVIQKVGNTKVGDKTNWELNKTLFEKARSGIELVVRARRGDNAKFQVKDFKKALKWDPTTMDLANPRSSTPWKVVDFKQTITDRAAATGQTREAVAKEVQKAAKNVYSKRIAKEHKVVVDGNRRALDRMSHCG